MERKRIEMELIWYNNLLSWRANVIGSDIIVNLNRVYSLRNSYVFTINNGNQIGDVLNGLENAQRYVQEYVSDNFKLQVQKMKENLNKNIELNNKEF